MLKNTFNAIRSLNFSVSRSVFGLVCVMLFAYLPLAQGFAASEIKTLQSQQAGEMTRPILASFQSGADEKPGSDLLMVKAWALQYLGRYEEALAVYEAILGAEPNRLSARYEKAVCLLELRRPADSGAEIAEIFKIAPKSLEYMALKFKNPTKLATGEKLEWEKAIEQYKPVTAAELLFKAEWFFANGRFGDALRLYKDLQRENANNVVPFLREAEILVMRKENKEAIAVIDRLIAQNGNCGAAWRIKGDALTALTRYAEALACYNKSEELGVENAKLYTKRGDLFLIQRSYREALADYTLALERTPLDSKILASRHIVYRYLGEQRKAYADLCKATDLSKEKMPELYFQRGMMAYELGYRQDAMKSLEEFLQLASDKDPSRAYAISVLAHLSY